LKEISTFYFIFALRGWNWAGRSILVKFRCKLDFWHEFLPFFLKILKWLNKSFFCLFEGNFNFLLHFCYPGMKLSWEIDFGQIPLETGFLTWNFFRFFLKFSKWWNKSFFAYLKKFQLFTSFLLSGDEIELGDRFWSNSVGNWILTWNFFRFFLNSPNDEINRFLLIWRNFKFLLHFVIGMKLSWEIDFGQIPLETGFWHEISSIFLKILQMMK